MGTGWGAGEANQIKLPREQLHTNGIGKVFVFFLRGCLTACTILLLLQLQDGVIEEEEFLAIVGQVLKVRSMGGSCTVGFIESGHG